MSTTKNICTVCNYIYDEAILEQPLKFEELADDWRCPECGSAREMFQPCSCVSFSAHESTGASFSPGEALSSQSLAKLVTDDPRRAAVFESLGLDYCCGGKETLKQACDEKRLALDEVVSRLLAADGERQTGPEPDWSRTSLKELIDHIVSNYHAPLREQLPRLTQMAEKVARVHGGRHPEMVELLEVFKPFREELELHMQKEELILFPGIAGIEAGGSPKTFGCGGSVEHPIEHMTEEHDAAGAALSAMRRLTNNYTAPADACNTFRVLLYLLSQLELEMHQHVHKENNILFPRTLELVKSRAAAVSHY